VKRPADQRKTLRLDPKEYRKLGTSLAKMAADGGNEAAITAVRLLAGEGCDRDPECCQPAEGL
jgi:hypothetical protein